MINKKILKYICCPKCKRELEKVGKFLICKYCRKKYKIIKDVPVLVDLASLDEHLRKQILYFEKEIKTKFSYILEEWQKSYIRRLDSAIPISDDDVVADIGTGSGYMAIELAKRGNVVLACDLNLKGLVRLKKISEGLNLTKRLLLFACSAEELPIKTNSVSIFTLNAVLEHLPNEEAAIKEIERACKKEAYGFITVPLKLKYILPVLWLVNIIHDKKIGHLRRYDEKDLKKKFGHHSFKIKEVFYTGHLVKVLGVLAQMLLKTHKFDKWLEDVDRKKEDKKYGASNILAIMKRDKNAEKTFN